MSKLREAIEAKKHGIIHQLTKNGLIPTHDPSVKDLTLSELESMLKQLKEPKREH